MFHEPSHMQLLRSLRQKFLQRIKKHNTRWIKINEFNTLYPTVDRQLILNLSVQLAKLVLVKKIFM